MILVSIDPGIKALGWARFHDLGPGRPCELFSCGASRNASGTLPEVARTHAERIARGVDVVALESMTVRGANSIPPQDLINVQTVGAIVAASLTHRIVLLTPEEWKGTVPKSIHHPRIRAALSEAERGTLGGACDLAGANAKEVLDAVGIGLYYLGRIDRAGITRTK